MGLFTGKTVIVTGGGKATLKDGSAGSIGYGIDIAFAKEGANLVITGRNVTKLEATSPPARTTRPWSKTSSTKQSPSSAASTRS